jgi:hypothetical protein
VKVVTDLPGTPEPPTPTPEPDVHPVEEAVLAGYAFTGPAHELGGLMLDAQTQSPARVRIPLAMVNRHGLVAGATGTERGMFGTARK